MHQPTTTEDTMNNLSGPVYGSPGAKALAKEYKAEEDRLNALLRDRSETGIWQRDRDEACRMSERARTLQAKRLKLTTCPLPCAPHELPARNYGKAEVAAMPDAPVDASVYNAGDLVAVYSRGQWRAAVVVEAHRTQVEVAYTTQGALDELRRYPHRGTSPTVTRKVVATKYLLGHQPKQPGTVVDLHTQAQAATVSSSTTGSKEGTMADEATQEEPKRRGGRKRLEPFADAQAVMAANKAAYDAFNKAHTAGDEAGKTVNRAGFTLYRRAYAQDLEARRATGDLKRQPKAAATAA